MIPDDLLTLTETAQLMHISKSWLYHNWPSFLKFGVAPMKLNGNPKSKKILFKKAEIIKLLESWKVR